MNENNILPINSDFEQIKRLSENGIEFWCSRDLCTALGYSTYQKFSRTIDKAIAIFNTILPINEIITHEYYDRTTIRRLFL